MIEYVFAIIVLMMLLFGSIIAIKIPWIGGITAVIGMIVFFTVGFNGNVIMGYTVVNNSVTTITQKFDFLPWIFLILELINIGCCCIGVIINDF